jgi:hypothetical protein
MIGIGVYNELYQKIHTFKNEIIAVKNNDKKLWKTDYENLLTELDDIESLID